MQTESLTTEVEKYFSAYVAIIISLQLQLTATKPSQDVLNAREIVLSYP